MHRGRKRSVARLVVHPVVGQLATLRQSRGVTLDVLGAKLGYNPYTIGAWERGKYWPKLNALNDWATYFGVELVLKLPDVIRPLDLSKLMGGR